MRLALASILLIAGCAYSGPAAFQEIGREYARDGNDCSDMAWKWIECLVASGTDPADGTEWLYDDPSAGYHGLPPWAYIQKFGSRNVVPVR